MHAESQTNTHTHTHTHTHTRTHTHTHSHTHTHTHTHSLTHTHTHTHMRTHTDITVDQLMCINPDASGQSVGEGQTILLPASKLSARDKEILEGIDSGYRMYPVRKGETLDDIMVKRGITLTDMQSLNPGTDLQHLQGK